MRTVILSVILAMAFGPAVQAAGLGVHGSCQGAGHAQHSPSPAAPSSDGADAAAHAGHHANHAAPDDVAKAPAKADGKCKCGCLCQAGHACSSSIVGAVSDASPIEIAPPHLSPRAELFNVPSSVPSPHTRPPIDALR